MKLEKIKCTNGGWHITCTIGKSKVDSWWSSPPDSINHADLGYINDRYSIITTEKRADEFKRLFKMLWIEG